MNPKRPRILLITRNLPPLRGGMERLNRHLALALATWGEVTVIGPSGCRQHLPTNIRVLEVPFRPLAVFLFRASIIAAREARNHPDIVIAGSGLTGPLAQMTAYRTNAKGVVYVHGLDIVASNLIYQILWIPFLRRIDLAIANSTNTADLAARDGIARGRITVIHPGVTLPTELPDPSTFREDYGLGNAPLLLSVGRLTERKGLAQFVQHVLPAVCAAHPDVRLVHIGDDAPNALKTGSRDGNSEIARIAANLGLKHNVQFLGPCDDATLARAYTAADVHVFPALEVVGDVEGFGMVAIEAAAHGLLTVAFATGGIPDAVRPGKSGFLVRPGDYAGFAKKIIEILGTDLSPTFRNSARKAARDFSWDRFNQEFLSELAEVLKPAGPITTRRGHAILDLNSRDAKAQKIETLLNLGRNDGTIRMLEVGTGSGGIAHYFGSHPTLRVEVESVDVSDTRQIFDNYNFTKVTDTHLPFSDNSFDVVISNHVIEHVGNIAAQRHHLSELHRVLRTHGVGYLAVPNRWQLVEPHYRLAFLSWLPERWRSPYLRWRNRGSEYDCRPLTVDDLETLLNESGFRHKQQHSQALRLTYQLERPRAFAYQGLLRWVPDVAYAAMRRAFPTLIYVLWPKETRRRS